jgi:hypothetical protein
VNVLLLRSEERFRRDNFECIIPISGTQAARERWYFARIDPCHKQFSFQTVAHPFPTEIFLRICTRRVLQAERSLLY